MTPRPPVPGVLKVTLNWSAENDTGAVTVFHLSYTGGPPSSANCATMAAAIQADAVTRFLALLNSEDSYVGPVTVLDLSSDMGGEGTGGDATNGTRAGDQLSAGTAVVVSKHVARHYRGGHPRSYLPLGSAGDIVEGTWGSTFAGNVNTAWTDFINDCTSDGTGCVITGEVSVSYVNGGAPRVTPQKDPILSYTTNIVVGSQRRRNRRQ